MSTNVDLVNNSLLLLGVDPIITLADATTRALLANTFLNPTTDAVLRMRPWNCAVSRKALVASSVQPTFGWTNSFDLPATPYCLRVLALNDDQECGDEGDYFKIEGRALLCDEATANIRYIGRMSDPTLYDSTLYQAIVFRLSSAMAYALTGSTSLAQGMWSLYEGMLKEAKANDAQEGSSSVLDISTLTDVR